MAATNFAQRPALRSFNAVKRGNTISEMMDKNPLFHRAHLLNVFASLRAHQTHQ
jgi:hypothetical protein